MSSPAEGGVSLERAAALLAAGEVRVEGRLPWSSNATYLARVESEDATILAVYKPRRGERPLWDFPAGSLCRRELAAFRLSEALGWQLVPPTVLRDGPYGPGMLQVFIPHDPELHFLAMDAPDPLTIQRLVAFDAVVNNADRKSGHVLAASDGALWAIDHGVTFHVEPKLRTVIWSYAGQRMPADIVADLERLGEVLGRATDPLRCELTDLLAADEVAATERRARRLARVGRFPAADPERRSYPWPPV
jgi:hypothetical protein